MLNIGEFRSEENGFVSCVTSTDFPQQKFSLTLNLGEHPREPMPSKLSQILEQNPDTKYNLSPKACQGILNRAERRGKQLPEELRIALTAQSAFRNEPDAQGGGKGILIQNERTGALRTPNNQSVCYGISSYDSNAMKSPNPHSGIYEAETSRTLDLNGGNPACNQGGIAVLAVDCRNGREGEINGTLQAKSTGGMSLNLNNVIRTRTDT